MYRYNRITDNFGDQLLEIFFKFVEHPLKRCEQFSKVTVKFISMANT